MVKFYVKDLSLWVIFWCYSKNNLVLWICLSDLDPIRALSVGIFDSTARPILKTATFYNSPVAKMVGLKMPS